MRFEREADGDRFTPVFPEVFSFHLDRHDPAELALQLEDLWSDPQRLGPGTTHREAHEWVRRLVVAAPPYLESLLDAVDADPRLGAAGGARVHGDAIVLARILLRFAQEKAIHEHPDARYTVFHLRKIAWRAARALLRERVGGSALEGFLSGALETPRGHGEPSDRALLQALAAGEDEDPAADALLLAVSERAFQRWLELVCLDESNAAFESEDSPFGTREDEILDAISVGQQRSLRRTSHITPFLRRGGNRDVLRILRKLEAWLLRQYDVPRAAAVIRHAENLARHRYEDRGVLSWHSTRTYLLVIAVLGWPFLGATFAYERAPLLFDAACSFQVVAVLLATLWYFLYRFVWQKDLAFFHATVPRIGAGIIVGYLPVFLIDEVWDLARRDLFPLGVVVVLLGFTTLLYLYVEVRRRIGDAQEAFARTQRIFLLGVVQALALGTLITTLLGRFMVTRTWAPEGPMPLAWLRTSMEPVVGQLPRIMGVEPVYAFPTAVLLMTFMSFFIGTFLQLLWEDLPITEPL